MEISSLLRGPPKNIWFKNKLLGDLLEELQQGSFGLRSEGSQSRYKAVRAFSKLGWGIQVLLVAGIWDNQSLMHVS